jgi:predicted nucleotidyltransferase
MRTLAAVVQMAGDDLGEPDYVVVFGSRARNAQQDASDVDLCFEATWVPRDPDRMVRARERQNNLVFDLMGWPRGLLLGRLRVQDEVARAVARDGRVYTDADGWYRNTLIVADEEALV